MPYLFISETSPNLISIIVFCSWWQCGLSDVDLPSSDVDVQCFLQAGWLSCSVPSDIPCNLENQISAAHQGHHKDVFHLISAQWDAIWEDTLMICWMPHLVNCYVHFVKYVRLLNVIDLFLRITIIILMCNHVFLWYVVCKHECVINF